KILIISRPPTGQLAQTSLMRRSGFATGWRGLSAPMAKPMLPGLGVATRREDHRKPIETRQACTGDGSGNGGRPLPNPSAEEQLNRQSGADPKPPQAAAVTGTHGDARDTRP